MQSKLTQAERIVGRRYQGNLLYRARPVVPLRLYHRHFRRLHRDSLNEIVFRQALLAYRLAGRYVIRAVLFDRHVGAINISGTGVGESHLPSIVQAQQAMCERPIRHNLQLCFRAFDSPEIATVLLDRIAQVHPVGMVVGHPDLLHGRNIRDTQMKVRCLDRPRLHVVLDVLG